MTIHDIPMPTTTCRTRATNADEALAFAATVSRASQIVSSAIVAASTRIFAAARGQTSDDGDNDGDSDGDIDDNSDGDGDGDSKDDSKDDCKDDCSDDSDNCISDRECDDDDDDSDDVAQSIVEWGLIAACDAGLNSVQTLDGLTTLIQHKFDAAAFSSGRKWFGQQLQELFCSIPPEQLPQHARRWLLNRPRLLSLTRVSQHGSCKELLALARHLRDEAPAGAQAEVRMTPCFDCGAQHARCFCGHKRAKMKKMSQLDVGDLIEVDWEQKNRRRCWHQGVIVSVSCLQATVLYWDGNTEVYDLTRCVRLVCRQAVAWSKPAWYC